MLSCGRLLSECPGFTSGVSSGDPTPNSVVIWTRFLPDASEDTHPVKWFLSSQPSSLHSSPEFTGSVMATIDTDFTVKVDVQGLTPGTRYYYFFQSGPYTSILGTTLTAPEEDYEGTFRFVQISCSNWRFGYFNAYDMAAKIRDLDVVVHLGDYIYEYSNKEYPSDVLPWSDQEVRGGLLPEEETVTLEQYRQRYRLYRTDVALLELHRRYPFINIWDDHEVADDSWSGGAVEHDVEEGDYQRRKCAAVQAFYEYVPVREPEDRSCAGRIQNMFRTFRWGKVATLAMVETRLLARTQQYDIQNSSYIQALSNTPPRKWESLDNLDALRQEYLETLGDPQRAMIGAQQLRGVEASFRESVEQGVAWQILANPVVMGPLNVPDLEAAVEERQGGLWRRVFQGLLRVFPSKMVSGVVPDMLTGNTRVLLGTGRYHDPAWTDSWTGYLHERTQLLKAMAAIARNPVVLSGDIHTAMVWRLGRDELFLGGKEAAEGRETIAVEFTAPSVTSPGLDQLAALIPLNVSGALDIVTRGLEISNRKALHYVDVQRRGVVVQTLTGSSWHADYYYVDNIETWKYDRVCGAAFDMLADSGMAISNGQCTPDPDLFLSLFTPEDPVMVPHGEVVAGDLLKPALPDGVLFSPSITASGESGR